MFRALENSMQSIFQEKFDVLIYNRVAKSGSTTTKLILETLSRPLSFGFTVHSTNNATHSGAKGKVIEYTR